MEPLRPKTNQGLKNLVRDTIETHGPECNLNHILVDRLMNFADVFKDTAFNGDISEWNTQHMVLANSMFENCPFNGDLSRWNTRSLRQSDRMFFNSKFTGEISSWNVASLENATSMFEGSCFNGDIYKWNTRCLKVTDRMFAESAFNGELSQWNIDAANKGSMVEMFEQSAFSGDLFQWRITLDQTGIHRLLSGNFKGIPPLSDTERTVTFYEDLFGSTHDLVAYLNKMPFGPMHFDVCLLATTKPHCVSDADFAWVKENQAFGEAVGLTGSALRTYCMERYGNVAIPEAMLSVDHLNLAS